MTNGVGAFFSQDGSSIYAGAAGTDIFNAPDSHYGDSTEYMPDHSVAGAIGEDQMFRNAGTGPLRSFRDGSLGRVVPTSRGPGLRRAYQDGSLGCTSCQGTGEYFQTNGVGEYFQTNGLGADEAPVTAAPVTTAADEKTHTNLVIGAAVVALVGVLFFLKKRR